MATAKDSTTIQELKDLMAAFSKERAWEKHHSPKNVSMSIAVEAAELMEHFMWEYDHKKRQEIIDEFADVMMNCMLFADVMDIDVGTAFKSKLARVKKKYPVELFNEDRSGTDDYYRIKKEYRSGKGKSA